jgi:HAD superfamily hydrolase (TIGR01509 family)
MTSLAAIVFDFDGVVLDSEWAAYEAHRRVYARCGVPLSREDWCSQVGVAMEEEEVSPWASRMRALSGDAPDPEDFVTETERLFNALVADVPMRGIAELLDRVALARVAVALASASHSRYVEQGLTRIGLRERFGVVVTGSDVRRKKPAPDVYLEAVRRLGVDARQSIAIEDSEPGIAAARAAGLKTVVIPHWLTEPHDLSAADLRVAHAGELTLERLEALVAPRA